MWTWIALAVVAVVGAGSVWWSSGRARPLGGDREGDRHRLEGRVESYRPPDNTSPGSWRM